MEDSTAVSNQWCMPVNFLCGAILFAPGLISTRSKVVKYIFLKKTLRNHRDYYKET